MAGVPALWVLMARLWRHGLGWVLRGRVMRWVAASWLQKAKTWPRCGTKCSYLVGHPEVNSRSLLEGYKVCALFDYEVP